MSDSILDSVKKSLGVDPANTAFDPDVILLTNSAFNTLKQHGVSPTVDFTIDDNTALWSDYVTDLSYLGLVKQFIVTSVKLTFDIPQLSFVIQAIQHQLDELGWRILAAVELANPPSDPLAP